MQTVNKKRKDGLLVSISQWNTYAEVEASTGIVDAAARQAKIIEFLVLYAQQKSAFPEAYDDLVEAIESEAKFSRKHTKTKQTIGGREVEVTTFVDPHRTEQDYIDDFIKVTNEHGNTHLGLDKAHGEGETFKSPARDWLQSVLNRRVYELSLKGKTRQKSDKIDQVYLDGAANIIKNGSQDQWVAKFEKVEVEVGDFQTEDIAANTKVLARGLRDWNNKRVAEQFK